MTPNLQCDDVKVFKPVKLTYTNSPPMASTEMGRYRMHYVRKITEALIARISRDFVPFSRRCAIFSLVLACTVLAGGIAGADILPPVKVRFFGPPLDRLATLIYGQTFQLSGPVGSSSIDAALLASHFCGATTDGSGLFRLVIGPGAVPADWHQMPPPGCVSDTTSQLKSYAASDAHPGWLAIVDLKITWGPWKFSVALNPSSTVATQVMPGHEGPSPTDLAERLKSLIARQIPTDHVFVGLDASNKVAVALGARFWNDGVVIAVSPNVDSITDSTLANNLITNEITSSPDLTTFIASFPIASVNSILAAQPQQDVVIPQRNAAAVTVSHLQLTAAPKQLTIRGTYSSPVYSANIQVDWDGDDLSLSRILVIPVLANCSAGDFSCVSNNAVANASSSAAATAYTTNNKDKKFRPVSREDHDIVIGALTLHATTQITKSYADRDRLLFFGVVSLQQ